MTPPGRPLHLLLVEDSESDAELVLHAFARSGLAVEPHRVQSADGLRAALSLRTWDAIICDFSMPGFGARGAMEEVRRSGHDLPFLLVSGTIPDEAAVELMREGARDYILKENLSRLVPAVQREIRDAGERRSRRQAEAARASLELQLRQVQKMEAIGQLSGGIAHDFNNILTVIQGHVSIMETEPGLSSDMMESIAEIGRAAERAANLTRQLLAFSRRQTLLPVNLDLNEVVANLTKMLQRIVGEDISVHLHFSPQPSQVHADAGMLEQVLLNLVVNARDAMPGGGRLEIETHLCEFDESSAASIPDARPGSFVCLSVSDTGCGIPPEVLPHVFEPFFTTKDVGKGTGLGLATVYGIVQQHRGWIEVHSDPGHGTLIRIYLPLVTTAGPVRSVTTVVAPVQGGTETILLVEDEPALRALMRNVLSRLGYRMLEAPSGATALKIWHEHRDAIDLLVTDMVMPDHMSGRELALRLLAERPTLRVIYISGYNARAAGDDFPLLENVNFVPKPFTPRKLANAVRACLDAAE